MGGGGGVHHTSVYVNYHSKKASQIYIKAQSQIAFWNDNPRFHLAIYIIGTSKPRTMFIMYNCGRISGISLPWEQR